MIIGTIRLDVRFCLTLVQVFLMYGMGEKQIVRIADKLRDGVPVNEITDIPGTCYISSEYDEQNAVLIPSYEECVESKSKYAVSLQTAVL